MPQNLAPGGFDAPQAGHPPSGAPHSMQNRPSGGFVVRDFCDDPYSANPDDVWLVQEPLFLSTYELLDDGDE